MSLSGHLHNATAYAITFEMLIEGGYNRFELVAQTGLAENTTRKLLMILKRRKVIHISGWDPDAAGRFMLAVYSLGPGPDAKRPPKLTSTQRSARQRVRDRLRRVEGVLP